MNPRFIPGNEPDSNDMAAETGLPGSTPDPDPADPLLAEEEEAAKLGDFA